MTALRFVRFAYSSRIFKEYPLIKGKRLLWINSQSLFHLIIQKALNYHQYLENYTLKKIEDIDCQKTIKDINFTDLKNLFFRTRTKKYDYKVIMHSSLKNRAGVLSLMHWNKRSSEQERRVDALALRAEERRDKLR